MASTISAGTTSGTAIAIAGDTTGNLALQTNNGTTAVTIDTSQNVGIGTTTPTGYNAANRALQIHGGANSSDIKLTNTTSGTGTTDGFLLQCAGADSYVWNCESGNTIFGTNNTERMRILANGHLSVGSTIDNSVIYAYLPTTAGDATTGTVMSAGAQSTSYTGVIYSGYCSRTSTNGSYALIDVLNGNATGRFKVSDSGNAQNTNNSYGSLSDIKLKENIVDASPKLEDLCKVQIRNYNLKNKPDEKHIGVVAQELEEVFAGLIEETKDTDEKGQDLGTTSKAVKYSVFVPMLIKAIQELNAKVDAQAAEIQALKAENT